MKFSVSWKGDVKKFLGREAFNIFNREMMDEISRHRPTEFSHSNFPILGSISYKSISQNTNIASLPRTDCEQYALIRNFKNILHNTYTG